MKWKPKHSDLNLSLLLALFSLFLLCVMLHLPLFSISTIMATVLRTIVVQTRPFEEGALLLLEFHKLSDQPVPKHLEVAYLSYNAIPPLLCLTPPSEIREI